MAPLSIGDKKFHDNICLVALPTPIESRGPNLKGRINIDAMHKLIDYVVKGGIDGIVVCGCTGFDSSLSLEEQVGLIKDVNDTWGNKTLVIAGDGANVTYEAAEIANEVEKKANVFAHLQVSPYKVKPSQEGIFQHYKSIAEAIEGQVILYHVISRTGGKGILPETAVRLAEIPRIIGIKDAAGDSVARVKRILESTQGKGLDFFVLSGDDNAALDVIENGGSGLISVAGNICPDRVSEMIHNFESDPEYARSIDRELSPLYQALFPQVEFLPQLSDDEPNPTALHYGVRRAVGIDIGIPRLPLLDLRYSEKPKMDDVLRDQRFSLFETY